jgi:hypothetical protein
VVRALVTEPVWADSGQFDPIPDKPRQFSDVKNDIANQLSGLPSFTARVKIGTNAPQNPGKTCLSCGLLNSPGVVVCVQCGTKLPAPNEYTITTIKPTGHIGTQQFDQRMKWIQAKNLQQDGYVRERTKVDVVCPDSWRVYSR